MAKKTRTELSTLAINTNLPDNTTELITPTTERSQLTDERESVVNYKDDLGGTGNAGKFLTVAVDGESLTMVDEPQGDIQGSGVDGQITYWDGTKTVTSDAMLLIDTTFKTLRIVIPALNGGGGISLNAVGASASSSLAFLNNGVTMAQLYYNNLTANLVLTSDGDVEISPSGTLSVDSDATFNGNVGIGTSGTPAYLLTASATNLPYIASVTANVQTVMASDQNNGRAYIGTRTDHPIGFVVNGNEKMRILSGGNVDFGTIGTIGSDATDLTIYSKDAGHNGLRFHVNGILPTDNAGAIIDNDADLGFPTYRFKDLYLGGTITSGGIAFPNQSAGSGTVSSSTLDAYEEGTWTGTMLNSNSTGDSTAVGTYVRVGDLVHCQVFFIDKVINNAGAAYVTGLPFTTASSSSVGYGIMKTLHNDATNSDGAYVNGTQFINLIPNTGSGSSWIIGTKSAMWAGTYKIN